jgi:uncharacterized protein YegP (UPF0339 family)
MTGRRSLLAGLAALALLGCQDAATDPPKDCSGGKCDSLGDTSGTDVMPRAPHAPGTISITRNGDDWLCEVIGSKGEIALLSRQYASRTSAFNGALSIEENGVLAERYVVSQSGAGWSFALRAGNNAVIADSEVFASEAEAQEAAGRTRELIAGIVQYKAALTAGARFHLDRDGSRWSFELLTEDEQPVLVSQTYSRRHDAINGIESVRTNGKQLGRYQLLDSPPRFILKAANGQEIAESSATFDTLEAAEAAIAETQALLISERVANPW